MKTKITLMVTMMVMAISAAAMPFSDARDNALFLSDKMAYELNLTESQYEATFEINLDYLLNIDDESDVFGYAWTIRERDMKQVLSEWQYANYEAREYFSRPFSLNDEGCALSVYGVYGQGEIFMEQPAVILSYQGGHSQMEGSYYAGCQIDKPVPPMYLGQAE